MQRHSEVQRYIIYKKVLCIIYIIYEDIKIQYIRIYIYIIYEDIKIQYIRIYIYNI